MVALIFTPSSRLGEVPYIISELFTDGPVTQLKLMAVLPASAPPPILIEICDGISAGAAANAALGVKSPETASSTTRMTEISFDIDFFCLIILINSSHFDFYFFLSLLLLNSFHLDINFIITTEC